MVYSNMLVTQRRLFERSDRRTIHSIISEQTRVVDAAIQTAHEAGFSHVDHELPTVFQLANFDKSDAQLLIYSELVSLYKRDEAEGGRGFEDVTITIGPRSYLHIVWVNGMEEDERAMRRRIILQSRRDARPTDARPTSQPADTTIPRARTQHRRDNA